MNEKNLKVLEQYDLEMKHFRRGRDSYIIESEDEIYLLKEYNGSQERVAWIETVCKRVRENGLKADMPLTNKEGCFVSSDRDGKRYIVKKWIVAPEIDVKNNQDICIAVENLALLHKSLTGMNVSENTGFATQVSLFDKRMRELRKIRRYVKEKKQKNSFELNFMKVYSEFMEMCQEASAYAEGEILQTAGREAARLGCVCHGDYNQHNILKDGQGVVTVNFENCSVGIQTMDLYCFMRKILEKHNWKIPLAEEMLMSYEKQRKLSYEERLDLFVKFLFPEKFWKISNHYYNSKKTWIPDRSLQKLDKVIQQNEFRKEFLSYFKEKYVLK